MSPPPQPLHTTPQLRPATQIRPSVSRSSLDMHVVGKEQSSQRDVLNNGISQTQQQQPMPAAYPYTLQMPTFGPSPQHLNVSPLSTSLLTESQLLLRSALDLMNPHTSFLTLGDEVTQQPFYSYNPNPNPTFKSERSGHLSAKSTHQASAPGSVLELLETSMTSVAANNNPSSATPDGTTTPPSTSAYGFNGDRTLGDTLKAPALTRKNSIPGWRWCYTRRCR